MMKNISLILSAVLLIGSALAKDPVAINTSGLRIISCNIEEVDALVKRQASEGFFVAQLSAEIVDHARNVFPRTGNIFHSENPVLVFEKRSQPVQQTVAVLDDVVLRLPQINVAGAKGMRMLGSEVVPLRSWAGGVGLDAYVALFELSPDRKFEYKIVDLRLPDQNQRLLEALNAGYQPTSCLAPSFVLLEKHQRRSMLTLRHIRCFKTTNSSASIRS